MTPAILQSCEKAVAEEVESLGEKVHLSLIEGHTVKARFAHKKDEFKILISGGDAAVAIRIVTIVDRELEMSEIYKLSQFVHALAAGISTRIESKGFSVVRLGGLD